MNLRAAIGATVIMLFLASIVAAWVTWPDIATKIGLIVAGVGIMALFWMAIYECFLGKPSQSNDL